METNATEQAIFFIDGRTIEQTQYGKTFDATTRKGDREKVRPFVGMLVYGAFEQVCIGCVDEQGLVIEHWECHDPYGTEYPLFLTAADVMANLLEINDNSCYNCYMSAKGHKSSIGILSEDKAA